MERKKEIELHITLPRPRSVPEDEIVRRRKVYDRLMRLRKQMAPLDITAEELVRQVREEADRRG